MQSRTNDLPSGRIVSIDALRGFDMVWIIGGGTLLQQLLALYDTPVTRAVASQLHHPEWSGFTAWDMIFPLFLFIVGASIPFSLAKRLDRGDSERAIVFHIMKRTAVLYFLGMIIEAGRIGELGGLRYTGVLHRIAFCYCCTSLIVMHTRIRGQAIWAAALLIGYWLVMSFIPVPGHGAGVFTPEGNLASYLDRLLQPGALRQKLFDNEGFLSTFPAIATTLLGVLSGHWLGTPRTGNRKTAMLLASGAASLIVGLIWSTVFPVNKLIWTSSFALVTGGLSMLILSVFYWLIDVRGFRKWAFPFVVIGLNALAIYFASAVFDFDRIVTVFTYEFIDRMGSFKPLFGAAAVLAVKWIGLYILYYKKIFIKI